MDPDLGGMPLYWGSRRPVKARMHGVVTSEAAFFCFFVIGSSHSVMCIVYSLARNAHAIRRCKGI
eukprot:1195901-Prorocentrum_minimum.AAC.7